MISVLIATSDDSAGGIERALHDQISLLQDDTALCLTILCPPSTFHDSIAAGHHALMTLRKGRKIAFRYAPQFAAIGSAISQPFDIALCHNGFMARGLHRYAKKVVGICHNDKPHHFRGCDHLVCLTQDGKNKAKGEGWADDKLSVIGHYHDIGVPFTVDKTSREQDIIIGAAGRMVAKKNFALFIEIAALVKQTHPQITFMLGGTGQLHDQLAALNHAKGAPVTMPGWVDFDAFLTTLDLFLVPSRDEPFGYIFPEAMAKGLALLSTQTHGANHCLDGGRIAPLYSPDDARLFANEICRLANDSDALLAAKKACYERAADPVFARQTAYQSWQALLRAIAL